jgi:hypothetical protein
LGALIDSIVIILAALSSPNCTLIPLALRSYPVDVTDGTQRRVTKIAQEIQ